MLADLRGAFGVLAMERVRQHDVHSLRFRVIAQLLKLFILEHLGDAILGGQRFRLGEIA